MTNHHAAGFWGTVTDTLHLWQKRYHDRHELAQWSDRDLHDIGVSWSDVADEIEKPFWRA